MMATNVVLTNYSKQISRKDLLEWFNKTLHSKIGKLEDLRSGAAYCRMMHMLFPSKLALNKVQLVCNQQFQYQHNFRLLQQSFKALNVRKHIDMQELVDGRLRANVEFAFWFKLFFEANAAKLPQLAPDYDDIVVGQVSKRRPEIGTSEFPAPRQTKTTQLKRIHTVAHHLKESPSDHGSLAKRNPKPQTAETPPNTLMQAQDLTKATTIRGNTFTVLVHKTTTDSSQDCRPSPLDPDACVLSEPTDADNVPSPKDQQVGDTIEIKSSGDSAVPAVPAVLAVLLMPTESKDQQVRETIKIKDSLRSEDRKLVVRRTRSFP